jgi:hypothetical protein
MSGCVCLGWGEVEMPVPEAADGVGDVRRHRGQINRLDGVAFPGQVIGSGGDVAGGGVDRAFSELDRAGLTGRRGGGLPSMGFAWYGWELACRGSR